MARKRKTTAKRRHLYAGSGSAAVRAAFRRKYGSRWQSVYGAVVGKVKREQLAKRKRRR